MVASVEKRPEVNQLAQLNPKHYRELVQKRGLNPDWVAVNCRSVDVKTATEHLGYTAYSDGILLTGAGYQEQFKPDKPWKSQDGKSPKYRSCKDDDGYDAMLPAHPNDPTFWDDLEALKERCFWIDGLPCLMITEGFFKALCLCFFGICTIALLGVEQGLTSGKNDPQGKRYLVSCLERLARAGFGFIIGFDADCATNDNVIKAQYKLAHQLALFGVPVYSVTGLWHEAEGKGIDDYIQMNGFDKFRDEVLSKAETIEQWKTKNFERLERQFNQGSKTKPPTPRETAKELTEEYQNWKYHNQQKTWRYWNGKCWESVDDGVFRSTVKTDIDGRGVNYSKADYISNVVSLMTDDLRVANWETLERFQYIPFDNGVLEVATKKLRKHNPNDGFTHVLPHAYKPVKIDNPLDSLRENCPNTYRYMMTSLQNNSLMARKMLATINGVITGKFAQSQLFLQLTGKTRSGKGTFTRLLKNCVGRGNHESAHLDKLDRLVTLAKIIDKMLVEIPEGRSISEGAISTLLALTGGDSVDCERKYKDPTSERFNGTLVITSNRQIGTAKYPELEERLCLITFPRTIPKEERILNLDQLIDAEIPQLVAIALSMGDAEVTQLLKGIGEGDNPEVKLHQWELKTEESVIAAFFNDALIVEPGKFVLTTKLYETFKSYCSDQGKQLLSQKRFARELAELFEHLNLGVNWNKEARNAKFEGVRLRKNWDTLPTYEESLRRSSAPIERAPAPIDANIDAPIQTQTQKAIAPIAPIESRSFSNQTETSNDSPKLPDPPENENPFKVGDRVLLLDCDKTGEVTEVDNSRYKKTLHIRLDNGIGIWEDPYFLELAPPKPEPKPEPKVKPIIYDLNPSDKERWLECNYNAKKTVWVELDDYQGEASFKGLRGGKWLIEPPHKWSPIPVESDRIFVIESQLGKFKPTPEPAGEQTELPLDQLPQQPPQPETPKQRVKRLVRQLRDCKAWPTGDLTPYLEKFGKSKLSELTDPEAAELGDRLQEELERFEKTKRDLNLH